MVAASFRGAAHQTAPPVCRDHSPVLVQPLPGQANGHRRRQALATGSSFPACAGQRPDRPVGTAAAAGVEVPTCAATAGCVRSAGWRGTGRGTGSGETPVESVLLALSAVLSMLVAAVRRPPVPLVMRRSSVRLQKAAPSSLASSSHGRGSFANGLADSGVRAARLRRSRIVDGML